MLLPLSIVNAAVAAIISSSDNDTLILGRLDRCGGDDEDAETASGAAFSTPCPAVVSLPLFSLDFLENLPPILPTQKTTLYTLHNTLHFFVLNLKTKRNSPTVALFLQFVTFLYFDTLYELLAVLFHPNEVNY